MANVFAVKSGSWSDPTVWSTGALPTSADDVYSNTFTVTVDISTTVSSISNTSALGVTAGGTFVPTNGITLTCTAVRGVVGGILNIAAFSSSLAVGQSCTLIGNCVASANGSRGALNGGAGTLNITGDCSALGIDANGARNTNVGIINITGNCTAAAGGPFSRGAVNGLSGTINITGSCTGGGSGVAHGAENSSIGFLNITGVCTGGGGSSTVYETAGQANGAANIASGTTTIVGQCIGGTGVNGAGAANTGTGTLIHIGPALASAAAPGIGLGAANQTTILTGPLVASDGTGGGAAASGVNPCTALRWFPADTALNTFEYVMRGPTPAGSPQSRPARRLFVENAYQAGYPLAGNVRQQITYGPNNIYTGTLAVPPAGSVAVGVPVDNTVGTASLTAVSPAEIATAVWAASSRTITDKAGFSLTEAERTAISVAVQAGILNEGDSQLVLNAIVAAIGNVNVNEVALIAAIRADMERIGGVLATRATASQVRTELAAELARMLNAATTQEVGAIVEGALTATPY